MVICVDFFIIPFWYHYLSDDEEDQADDEERPDGEDEEEPDDEDEEEPDSEDEDEPDDEDEEESDDEDEDDEDEKPAKEEPDDEDEDEPDDEDEEEPDDEDEEEPDDEDEDDEDEKPANEEPDDEDEDEPDAGNSKPTSKAAKPKKKCGNKKDTGYIHWTPRCVARMVLHRVAFLKAKTALRAEGTHHMRLFKPAEKRLWNSLSETQKEECQKKSNELNAGGAVNLKQQRSYVFSFLMTWNGL